MESLDQIALCNVASFLDLNSFSAFVTSCRAFATCRHHLRTLAAVALNTEKKHPERLVFFRFGPTAIRFFAERYVRDLLTACLGAIWIAVRQNNHHALSVLAPLCDCSLVEEILRECADYLPFAIEALNHMDVSPALHDKFRSEVLDVDIDVFDAVRHFDRTGELPTDNVSLNCLRSRRVRSR